MTKQAKKKNKKGVKLVNFTAVFFIISCTLFLASSLFLRSYNNALSTQKQAVEAKITEIQLANAAAKVEIQTLSTRERIDTIASDNGLKLHQDNIITITTSQDNGE
ncbi:MAG: hypothetical protein IKF00_13100 [Solobacterium sp.]|jgi:cell division protein FtsL|nr:hypothetical protein [Solobacterium sp.]MDO4192823.1 hypothetical protein [Erysipelotrichaceae bacterium]MBR2846137.1 hypothetical protein [Solobacterium sp.]MBR3344742.1 hypothetical protein [Solobacterium sp.]MCR5449611.1 hypothetical protein [Solobacterium sp.]